MVFITIQGAGQGGKHDRIKDGKKLDDLAWNDEISKLLNFIDKNNIDANDEVFTQIGTQYFCTQAHPLKDIYGRTRLAMLWWDENENLESLKLNLELMGLNYNEFVKKFEKFKQQNEAVEIKEKETKKEQDENIVEQILKEREQNENKKDFKLLFLSAFVIGIGALIAILSLKK